MLKQSKDLKDMRAAPLQQTEKISVVLSVFSSIAPIYYEWKEEKRQPCTATKTDAIIHIILMQYYIIYSRLYTLVLMLSFWFEYVFIYFLLLRYNSPGFSWMYFFFPSSCRSWHFLFPGGVGRVYTDVSHSLLSSYNVSHPTPSSSLFILWISTFNT